MQADLFDDFVDPTELRIRRLRDRLLAIFGQPVCEFDRSPMEQLIKSMIGSRTKDEDSLAAYNNLRQLYPSWKRVQQAGIKSVEAAISGVNFADRKARDVIRALVTISRSHPDYDLAFLGAMPSGAVMTWLCALRGVGVKVAAAVMNFSTLRMPAFVMDTHVLRVLSRLGIIPANTRTAEQVYDRVMTALSAWPAEDLSDLHVLVKRFGQDVCQHTVIFCRQCPFRGECRAMKRV